MHDLRLSGCRPQPLLSYLKALAVFRLVAEQVDSSACAWWSEDTLHLRATLDAEGLIRFFLDHYRPTPIIAPWNGGSGFFPKDTQVGVEAIRQSTSPRLGAYRAAVAIADEMVRRDLAGRKPTKSDKLHLLARCRAEMPDVVVPWLDAVFVLTTDGRYLAPLLGSGGNDGRLEFSSNFMQRITEALATNESPGKASARERSEEWLRFSILAIGNMALREASVGQFHPGGVGGPNATQGFEAESLVNPWDYILMIEGSLMFAGATARQLGANPSRIASFPFIVGSSAAGWGTITSDELSGNEAEVWAALWDRPATYPEIRHVFAEGRAQVGRRQARNGTDFARAAAQLGVDRGLRAFQRYGILAGNRSGRSHLAVPLGRIAVQDTAAPGALLLGESDPWLVALRRFCSTREASQRHHRALRAIEDAIFRYCERPQAVRLQSVLRALGQAEHVIAQSPKAHDAIRRPLGRLSPQWLRACDDRSPEFRLAAAVASVWDKEVGPIRAQMEPVALRGTQIAWAEDDRGVVWGGGDLCHNLDAVLERRLRVQHVKRRGGEGGQTGPPIGARICAGLADVGRFLAGDVDDSRLGELMWGYALLNWADYDSAQHAPAWPLHEVPELSGAYALVKLCFLPEALKLDDAAQPVTIRPDPAILARLRAGDVGGALSLAWHRLRASGLTPLTTRRGARPSGLDMELPPGGASRLAAALLIPIWQTRSLAARVLRPPADATAMP